MDTSAIESYIKLREELDHKIAELESKNSTHMKCANTCSSCCINFGVLGIEKYVIQNNTPANIANNNDTTCKFLIDDSCSIYEHRPFICRTQGLPIVHFNEETEVYDLSVCELNFTDVDISYFTEDNCLFMDDFNSELYSLNQKFISNYRDLDINENDLFDMNTL